MKCINECQDPAEQNFTWPTSKGPMSANFCGVCAAASWDKYKNTPSFQSIIIDAPKSAKEIKLIMEHAL